MLDGTTETLDNNGTAKAMYNLPFQTFLTFGCCSVIGVVTGVSVSFAVIRRIFDQLTVGCGNAIILCFLLFWIMRNIGVVS
jgi:hypothetical protein